MALAPPSNNVRPAGDPNDLIWPQKDPIVMQIEPGPSPALCRRIAAAVKPWADATHVTFLFLYPDGTAQWTSRYGVKDDIDVGKGYPTCPRLKILVTNHGGNGHGGGNCYIGRNDCVAAAASGGIVMNLRCGDGASNTSLTQLVLHEFGHLLGFSHEHQHPHSPYRELDLPAIAADQGWSCEATVHNLAPRSDLVGGGYDRDSIMHYDMPEKFLRSAGGLPKPPVHNGNRTLSSEDIRGAAQLYNVASADCDALGHPSSGHCYFIREHDTGKYLDVRGGSSSPGTDVIVFNLHQGPNQIWQAAEVTPGKWSLIPKCCAPMILALHVPASSTGKGIRDSGRFTFYQSVHVVVYLGFGFLTSYLCHGLLSATGHTMIIASLASFFAILARGFFGAFNFGENITPLTLNIRSIIEADFAAAAVLVSFGAMLGRLTVPQLLAMAFCEVIFDAFVEARLNGMGAADVGGALCIHLFGAVFGLCVSTIACFDRDKSDRYNKPSDISNALSMIGSLFLFVYFPSFNAAAANSEQSMTQTQNIELKANFTSPQTMQKRTHNIRKFTAVIALLLATILSLTATATTPVHASDTLEPISRTAFSLYEFAGGLWQAHFLDKISRSENVPKKSSSKGSGKYKDKNNNKKSSESDDDNEKEQKSNSWSWKSIVPTVNAGFATSLANAFSPDLMVSCHSDGKPAFLSLAVASKKIHGLPADIALEIGTGRSNVLSCEFKPNSGAREFFLFNSDHAEDAAESLALAGRILIAPMTSNRALLFKIALGSSLPQAALKLLRARMQQQQQRQQLTNTLSLTVPRSTSSTKIQTR